MLLKNLIFMDLQTLQNILDCIGGLNTARIKFSLVTPKTAKSAKTSPLKIFRDAK